MKHIYTGSWDSNPPLKIVFETVFEKSRKRKGEKRRNLRVHPLIGCMPAICMS